jgi:acetate kinase
MSAVEHGRVVDTSMGLTPLEGCAHDMARVHLLTLKIPMLLGLASAFFRSLTECMLPMCRLMMGTRCGDIDPSVVIYLAQHCGMPVADIDKLMNKQARTRHS